MHSNFYIEKKRVKGKFIYISTNCFWVSGQYAIELDLIEIACKSDSYNNSHWTFRWVYVMCKVLLGKIQGSEMNKTYPLLWIQDIDFFLNKKLNITNSNNFWLVLFANNRFFECVIWFFFCFFCLFGFLATTLSLKEILHRILHRKFCVET